MESREKTVGIRNLNYLNVKNNARNPWQGSLGVDERGHTKFRAPEWGLRAAIITLRTYWFSYGLRNVSAILSRWAPDTDTIGSLKGALRNDPDAYSRFVCGRVGVGPGDDLHLFHPDKRLNNVRNLQALIAAMAEFENYNGFRFPDDEFVKALFLVEPDRAPGTSDQGTQPSAETSPLTRLQPPPHNGSTDLRDDLQISEVAMKRLMKISAFDLITAASLMTREPEVVNGLLPSEKGTSKTDAVKPTTQPQVRRAVPTGGFEISDAILRRLIQINAFPIPEDDTMIFFGLRGCVPLQPSEHQFVASAVLKVSPPNYQNPRCTIGQWRLKERTIAVFPGSTVPTLRYVEASARKHQGNGTNLLLTGYYYFEKGVHRADSPSGHPAFRQKGRRIYRRTADDAIYEPTDKVEIGEPWDNLHAAFGDRLDGTYSSAGCQVVLGHPDREPWPTFRDSAYKTGQKVFRYILLDATEASDVSETPEERRPLQLRCGSHEEGLREEHKAKVRAVQRALGVEEDGDFGAETALEALKFQREASGGASPLTDGVVGPQTAAALKIEPWPIL